jgi:hypothetical protein
MYIDTRKRMKLKKSRSNTIEKYDYMTVKQHLNLHKRDRYI